MAESPAQPFDPIRGVMTVSLQGFGDDRGRFMETFRVRSGSHRSTGATPAKQPQ